MNIRRAKKEDFKEIEKLLLKTFDEFLTPYFTKKAAANFKNKEFSTQGLLSRIDRFMFVAEENKKIIGFMEANLDRVFLFFVDKKHQGKGIGKKLIQKIESLAKKNKIKKIFVNSSIYSVPIYQSLGFKKTTGERVKEGKHYQPMKKILN